MNTILQLTRLVCAIVLLCIAQTTPATSPLEQGVWETFLKNNYFKDINLVEDKTVIDLETPYRTEDAALTPVSVHAQIPQTDARYIKTIYIFVDKNPQPLVGIFHFTPDVGKAELATRIRINEYTNVRAIAILNNGEHHMVANFVKAQGGCSAPLGADLVAARARMGQMKFRTLDTSKVGELTTGQLLLSHPNITGMQMDMKTRSLIPEHYVKRVNITYNDKPLITAEVGFSMSADPSIRFMFIPAATGKVNVDFEDSQGMKWAKSFDVNVSNAAETPPASST